MRGRPRWGLGWFEEGGVIFFGIGIGIGKVDQSLKSKDEPRMGLDIGRALETRMPVKDPRVTVERLESHNGRSQTERTRPGRRRRPEAATARFHNFFLPSLAGRCAGPALHKYWLVCARCWAQGGAANPSPSRIGFRIASSAPMGHCAAPCSTPFQSFEAFSPLFPPRRHASRAFLRSI
ncbi:hypothetical protein EDB80DRAFT_374715 [Ilyonectria destructans]|nr:hypothetical protein EDB80DRAFT_374715 [Ilyonectria destructans]